MTFVKIYDLRNDTLRVQRMQQASVNRPALGLALEPALVASDEWWAMTQDGRLQQTVLDGVITRRRSLFVIGLAALGHAIGLVMVRVTEPPGEHIFG